MTVFSTGNGIFLHLPSVFFLETALQMIKGEKLMKNMHFLTANALNSCNNRTREERRMGPLNKLGKTYIEINPRVLDLLMAKMKEI